MREIVSPPAQVARAEADLSRLAQEINLTHDGVVTHLKSSLTAARDVGRLLVEAREQIQGHKWLAWLRANVKFSERQARNFIRIAENWDRLSRRMGPAAELTIRDALALISSSLSEDGAEEAPKADSSAPKSATVADLGADESLSPAAAPAAANPFEYVAEQQEAIGRWVSARRRTWPEACRPAFGAMLRRLAEHLDDDDLADGKELLRPEPLARSLLRDSIDALSGPAASWDTARALERIRKVEQLLSGRRSSAPVDQGARRPRLLDLFCGAGGCAAGYHRAGFDVTGVDVDAQPNYPFPFVRADALAYLAGHGHEYDVIHASPPCQAYTSMSNASNGRRQVERPRLIADVLAALDASGKPWVVENVCGAKAEFKGRHYVRLRGEHFGLKVHRPRLFATNVLLLAPDAGPVQPSPVAVYGPANGRLINAHVDGTEQRGCRSLDEGSEAMGIDWMTWDELKEAVPPAYTAYVGGQLGTVRGLV